MNIFTRIVLSLSLITFIAQPVQAASYASHAKKAGRIAWHISKIAGGILTIELCRSTVQEIKKFKGNAHYLNSRKNILTHAIREQQNSTRNLTPAHRSNVELYISAQQSELDFCNGQIQMQKSAPAILAWNGTILLTAAYALIYNGFKGLGKEYKEIDFNLIEWIKTKLGKKTNSAA